QVAEHIVDHHHKKSRDQMYTAIFTVQSIPMAMKYYQIMQKLKTEGRHDLNISTILTYHDNEDSSRNQGEQQSRDILETIMKYYKIMKRLKNEGRQYVNMSTIFTYHDNEDSSRNQGEQHSRDSLETVKADYNQMFQTNFSTDTFDSYFNDISKRVKKGIPGQQIDILIVSDMFLTGFDSKKLNTLYVDRNLKHHTLIKAYSQTNRVEKPTKPYGNIVCYRNLKERTDEAIELFSQTDNTDTVLSLSFDEYLTTFQALLQELFDIAPTPGDVDQLEREDDQKQFVLIYRDLAN